MTNKKAKLTGLYLDVYEMLPVGDVHPLSSKKIAKALNISTRDVMDIINKLITVYNRPIGASRRFNSSGYYIISSLEELKSAMYPYQSQVQQMNKRLKILKQFESEMTGND
jgi:hypothetical protein